MLSKSTVESRPNRFEQLDVDDLETRINTARVVDIDWQLFYDQVPLCSRMRKKSVHMSPNCYNPQLCQKILLISSAMAAVFPILSELLPKIREQQADRPDPLAVPGKSDDMLEGLLYSFSMTVWQLQSSEEEPNRLHHPRRELIAMALELHTIADDWVIEQHQSRIDRQARVNLALLRHTAHAEHMRQGYGENKAQPTMNIREEQAEVEEWRRVQLVRIKRVQRGRTKLMCKRIFRGES